MNTFRSSLPIGTHPYVTRVSYWGNTSSYIIMEVRAYANIPTHICVCVCVWGYVLVMSMMLKFRIKHLCGFSLSYLKSQLGSGSFFFSENESLGSASITKSLGSASKSSVLFTPLDEIYIIIH